MVIRLKVIVSYRDLWLNEQILERQNQSLSTPTLIIG